MLASVGLANNVDAYRFGALEKTTDTESGIEGVTIMRTFQGKTYTELWEEFGDVPMNPETECIEVAWCGFPKGTHREDIWHWFESTFGVAVHDLMYS